MLRRILTKTPNLVGVGSKSWQHRFANAAAFSVAFAIVGFLVAQYLAGSVCKSTVEDGVSLKTQIAAADLAAAKKLDPVIAKRFARHGL